MPWYKLTASAKQDLREIGLYTKQTWGVAQAKKYLQSLYLALKKLSGSPKVGSLREEIAPEIRSFRLGHHVAYYVEKKSGIIIVRILHPSMDTKRAL
ncbi:MAG: type II toxin-antitoxin system RelE/ParE family toxin [Waddliaceae bacterium]